MEFNLMSEIVEYCKREKKDLAQAMVDYEVRHRGVTREQIYEDLKRTLLVMEESVDQGLTQQTITPSGMLNNWAKRVYKAENETLGSSLKKAVARAIAVGEVNACMGKIAAAPTAGLHLTPELLARLSAARIRVVQITLHVGLGTFAPIRVEQLDNHVMHSEEYFIPEETARLVEQAGPERVTAVGTTVVRALESAARDGTVRPGPGVTDLFIKPGYSFRVVGGLMTNFHTPKSSLIVMVSAFAGREQILGAYETAVRERYRFFSYGDAMLIQ